MPTCIEKKILLSGAVQTYVCELIHFSNDFGILKYVIDRSYDISGLQLRPGDITYALYWGGRPYTLYIWQALDGGLLGHYFNIADQVSLQPHEFTWRDLVVDVLVDSSNTVHVLDEHELPNDLDVALSTYISEAKSLILAQHQEIIREADIALKQFAEQK